MGYSHFLTLGLLVLRTEGKVITVEGIAWIMVIIGLTTQLQGNAQIRRNAHSELFW